MSSELKVYTMSYPVLSLPAGGELPPLLVPSSVEKNLNLTLACGLQQGAEPLASPFPNFSPVIYLLLESMSCVSFDPFECDFA